MSKDTPVNDRVQIVDQLSKLLSSYSDVVAVYLFGSVAQGKAHQQSDIDVALLFDSTLDRQSIHDRTLAVGTLLETHLPTAIDVVALNTAPLLLQFQILQKGVLILEHNRTQRCLFQMRSMSRYYDAKPFLHYQQQQAIKRIQTQGLGHGYHGDRNALTKARQLRETLAPTARG